jgi:uncharacterized membrane protein YeaQ/YmgE (transglycosylase-associated protein family)
MSSPQEQHPLKLIKPSVLKKRSLYILDSERIVTTAIVIGIFGGLVGGPILSLADYYAPPERRFWTFIIPEPIGFGCIILMVIYDKSKKRKKNYQPDGNDNL